jgi:hypothetical protein
VRQDLHRRLKALEGRRVPSENPFMRTPLPTWLMEELRQEGVRFDGNGHPDWNMVPKEAPAQ